VFCYSHVNMWVFAHFTLLSIKTYTIKFSYHNYPMIFLCWNQDFQIGHGKLHFNSTTIQVLKIYDDVNEASNCSYQCQQFKILIYLCQIQEGHGL
jgi:hypothetical protein